jgi:hypothetical protein
MKQGKLLAATINVYAGEDDEYFTFITPEALPFFRIMDEVSQYVWRKYHKRQLDCAGSISYQCLSMSNSCTLYIVAQCSTVGAIIIQWKQEDGPEDNSDHTRTG